MRERDKSENVKVKFENDNAEMGEFMWKFTECDWKIHVKIESGMKASFANCHFQVQLPPFKFLTPPYSPHYSSANG